MVRTRRSIERQTALKAAVEWGIAYPSDEDVLAVAQRFFGWLSEEQS